MTDHFIGLTLVFLGGLIIGMFLGISGNDSIIEDHCSKYGQHKTEKFSMVCTKIKE